MSAPDGTAKRITLSEVDVVLRPDGILEYVYTLQGEVDVALARKAVATARELTSTPRPTVVHINRVKGLSREARVFFAQSPENREVSSHIALIIDSPLSRAIGNFFIGLNKPEMPTRLFNSAEDAIAWLTAAARAASPNGG